MAGLQHAGMDPGIVWFDAHGDVQTLETTASGYLGGLPLRLLVGYRPGLIATDLGLRPVAEQRVVLAGARDLDPPEISYLDQALTGRAQVQELDAAALPDGPLYVHLDLDVIDPGAIPGLRYPAPGGPPCAQVAAALGTLLATGRVAAVGIACTWHPGHAAADAVDPHLKAAFTATEGRSSGGKRWRGTGSTSPFRVFLDGTEQTRNCARPRPLNGCISFGRTHPRRSRRPRRTWRMDMTPT